MSLTFSGSIIGISYGEMNSIKSNLRRANDMLQQSQSKVNSAKAKVQIDRSSSRLRLSEEQISTIYTTAAKQKTKIDKLCNNIDITIRKFKEVDARCAARIRSISKSYDKSKSIWDRIKSAFSSFSTFAMNGFKSLIEEGKEALCALGEKASEGFSAVSEWMDKHPVVADTLEIVGGVAQAAAYAALFANPITAPIAAVGLIFSAGSILESGSKLFNYLTTGNNKGINVLEMAFETVGEKLGGDKGKAIGDTIYNVMNTGVMVGGLVIDCGLTLTKTGEIIKDSEGAIKGLKALSEGAKAAESIKFEALKNFLVNPLKDLVDAGKYLRDNFIPPINFGKLSLAGVDDLNLVNIGKIAEDFVRDNKIGTMSTDSGISGLINKINRIVDDFTNGGFTEKASDSFEDFSGMLKGEKVQLSGVKTKKINYTKREPIEAEKLRKIFNSTERKKFLQSLVEDVDKLKRAGLTDSDIARMRDGLNPKGWQVHHKLPLDDGGTNDLDNLILIKNDPYHKAITNFQNTFAKQLNTGETKIIEWPIPEGNIYPPNN